MKRRAVPVGASGGSFSGKMKEERFAIDQRIVSG
jgi:hypothetical protein